MTNYSVKTVSKYIAAAPKEARAHLREIRSAVKSAVPKVEEGISYGKPYYKYHGMLAGFDAYKNHIGFEIWTSKLAADDRKKLKEKDIKREAEHFKLHMIKRYLRLS
jgi:uncharacterized protein